MKFCSSCQNMYYLRMSAKSNTPIKNNLIYYCRKCGNTEEPTDSESVCVSTLNLKKGEQNFSHVINKYTKYDPTLPRMTNMKCPSTSCESNVKDYFPEIISVRYDDENVKYVYSCTVCESIWRPSV